MSDWQYGHLGTTFALAPASVRDALIVAPSSDTRILHESVAAEASRAAILRAQPSASVASFRGGLSAHFVSRTMWPRHERWGPGSGGVLALLIPRAKTGGEGLSKARVNRKARPRT